MRTARYTALVAATAALGLLTPAALADSAAPESETVASVDDCVAWPADFYDRPTTHQGSTVLRDLLIPVTGEPLAADVHLPGDGTDGPYPVALTITGYGKNALGLDANLVAHGYAHVVVDDRGTGASGGQWDAWSTDTQGTYGEVVDWIAAQAWAQPRVGMIGASYMGLTQLFTAAQQPEALKAVFAHVPSGDAYRDIVFQGGQFNAAFIPAWMGIMVGTGAAPSSTIFTDPVVGLTATADRYANIAGFKAETTSSGALGGEAAYDSEFWRSRSPIEVLDRIEVPVFLLGGLDDLFQRSTPMLYEGLDGRAVETKLIEGPWDHLGGSTGSGLASAGLPPIDQISLQWFDEHVAGRPEAVAECVPDLTQWIRRSDPSAEGYEVQAHGQWPAPDLVADRLSLHGDGAADLEAHESDEPSQLLVQNQPGGACSRSASQWTLGAVGYTPCGSDNRLNETGEIVYTSPPVAEVTDINGPVQVDLHLSSTAPDAAVTVALSIVDADGRSRGVTNGLMTASFAVPGADRDRLLADADGALRSIQPWYDFTPETQVPLAEGEIRAVSVELFQVAARLQPGERIRVSVGAADQPHAAPTATQLVDEAGGVVTLHHGATTPASITLPVVGGLPAFEA